MEIGARHKDVTWKSKLPCLNYTSYDDDNDNDDDDSDDDDGDDDDSISL